MGVWCYFYLHLTHPYSIFVTPLSSNPPLSPITPLDFPGSESANSFYFYLPLWQSAYPQHHFPQEDEGSQDQPEVMTNYLNGTKWGCPHMVEDVLVSSVRLC